MKCSAVTFRLDRYAEKRLSDSEAKAVSEHLGICKVCKGRFQEINNIELLLDENPVAEMTELSKRKLYEAVNIYRLKRNRASWYGDFSLVNFGLGPRIAFSAVALLAAFGGFAMSYDLWVSEKHSSVNITASAVDNIYHLDAFDNRTNGSIYNMYADLVSDADRGERP